MNHSPMCTWGFKSFFLYFNMAHGLISNNKVFVELQKILQKVSKERLENNQHSQFSKAATSIFIPMNWPQLSYLPVQSDITHELNTLEILTREGKSCLGSATDVAEDPQEQSCSAASMENHNHPAPPDLPPPTHTHTQSQATVVNKLLLGLSQISLCLPSHFWDKSQVQLPILLI